MRRNAGQQKVTSLLELVAIASTPETQEDGFRDLVVKGFYIPKFNRLFGWKNCDFVECDFARDTFLGESINNCSFAKCNFESGHKSFKSAKLRLCFFEKCDLIVVEPVLWQGVTVENCRFSGSLFRGTKIDDSRFTQTWLQDADFEYAKVGLSSYTRVRFDGCEMTGVNLGATKLVEVLFSECNMRNATLYNASMKECEFDSGDLARTRWDDAKVKTCSFRGEDMHAAAFSGTEFDHCHFRQCNLDSSVWKQTKIRDTDFVSCSAEDADVGRVSLQDTNFEEIVAGAPSEPRVATGKVGRAIAKVKALPAPTKVGDFKHKYPDVFAAIKGELQGLPNQEVTPQLVDRLIDKYGFKWQVSKATYTFEAQRLSPKHNDVLQLNLSMDTIAPSSEDKRILGAIRDLSTRSGHPVRKHGDLWTIGWVRYSEFPDAKTVLVEEIQSDVPAVRMGLKDPDFKSQLEEKGLEPEEIGKAVELLMPFAARFYEDAMSLIFDQARDAGYEVEMLTYASKKRFGSPQNVYTDLPKGMGMRKRERSAALPSLPEVWHLVPNKRRGR